MKKRLGSEWKRITTKSWSESPTSHFLLSYIYTERKSFLLLLYVNYTYICINQSFFFLSFPSFTFINRRLTHIQAGKRMVHGYDSNNSLVVLMY